MSEPNDYEVAQTMQLLGGSFAKRLGELFNYADTPNQLRLKAAFPELWEEYRELVQLRKQRAG